MFASISNVGIRDRLMSGFALICLLLAATVGYTVYATSEISGRIRKVVDLRAPVAITSTQLVGNLYSTLSTLRGYLLTGDAEGLKSRAAMWTELDQTARAFDRMAVEFTNSENKAIWSGAKALIAEFRQAQAKAESIAFTPDAYPATKLLSTEAAPLIATMFGEVTKMIDEEETLGGEPRAQASPEDAGGRARQPCRGRIPASALRGVGRNRRPRKVRAAAEELQIRAGVGQRAEEPVNSDPGRRLRSHGESR